MTLYLLHMHGKGGERKMPCCPKGQSSLHSHISLSMMHNRAGGRILPYFIQRPSLAPGAITRTFRTDVAPGSNSVQWRAAVVNDSNFATGCIFVLFSPEKGLADISK